MPNCKLCDQDKPLIEAHIFPDWAYRPLKDKGKHFIQLTEGLKERKLQSGHWDSNILCKECDGDVIGKYDTYAADFFNQDFSPLLTTFKETNKEAVTYHVKDFNYTKLYIYIISIFWRASITNNAAFAKVDLGPYENIAKEIILSGVPKHEDIFEVAIFAAEPPASGERFEKSVIHPFRTKFGDANCYRFVIAGFEFVLKVDQRKSNLHITGITMHPDGFNIILIPFEGSTMGKFVAKYRKKFRERREQL